MAFALATNILPPRLILLPIVTALLGAYACGSHDQNVADSRSPDVNAVQSELPSAEVARDLTLLREEEKLARDVYVRLYDEWGSKPFSNISSSEQRHMDSVRVLLSRYEMSDPVVSDAAGVFTNEAFQQLYTELTQAGTISLLAAFQVGAEIEELDIADIQRMQSHEPNEAVRAVYDNLQCGSRNHLRAFVGQIVAEGGTFAPKHLSQAEVNAIVEGSQERCGMR
jgi:hypothetical protein